MFAYQIYNLQYMIYIQNSDINTDMYAFKYARCMRVCRRTHIENAKTMRY
jgi:hypothetical protein